MKTIAKIKYVLFLIVIVGFVSCKGEIGPIGPDGTDGIDGIAGTDGIAGVDGEDGNANVISSEWLTPTWSAINSTFGRYDYATTDFTEDIRNYGVILSYCDWKGDIDWVYPIPYTFSYFGSNTVSFNFELYSEKISWFFIAESDYTPPPAMRFRYVIIPSSGTKSANSKQATYDELENAGVDINNYFELMDYYGLDY